MCDAVLQLLNIPSALFAIERDHATPRAVLLWRKPGEIHPCKCGEGCVFPAVGVLFKLREEQVLSSMTQAFYVPEKAESAPWDCTS